MKRVKMVGSALSQLLNVLTAFELSKTGPNESVSARMHRQKKSLREKLIDSIFRLFGQKKHCERAYMSDVSDAYDLIREYERGRNDL